MSNVNDILAAEMVKIRTETTAATLARRSVKKGRTLSKAETVQFLEMLNDLNPEKREHCERITKHKLVRSVGPGKQYSLWGELGL